MTRGIHSDERAMNLDRGEVTRTLERHCPSRGRVTGMYEWEGELWLSTSSGSIYSAYSLPDGAGGESFCLTLEHAR